MNRQINLNIDELNTLSEYLTGLPISLGEALYGDSKHLLNILEKVDRELERAEDEEELLDLQYSSAGLYLDSDEALWLGADD